MSFENIDRAALTDWVNESCARQGIPVKITNPVVVANIATVLIGDRGSGHTERRRIASAEDQARHSGTIRSGSTVRVPGVPGRIVA